MSTEARRASVPPRPDVPPQPGVPPRPTTPPRPAQPPADPETGGRAPAEPPHPDPARSPAPGPQRQDPTQPRPPSGPPRQQPEHGTRPRATTGPPRQKAPGGATPGQGEPAGARRASADEAGAPASTGERTARDAFSSPDTASPVPRTAPRFTGLRAQHTDAMTPPPPPASARFPDTPPPARPASAPGREDSGTPARAEDRPATPPGPRPAPPHDFRRAARPTRPAPGPASPDGSRPAGTGGARPAGPDGTRPTDPSAYAAGPGTRPAESGTRPEEAGTSSRPADSVGAAVPESGGVWSPLPRSWVPAPGRSPRETPAGPRDDSPAAPAADDGPAWSPGASVRQHAFAVPPAPPKPPTPPAPEAPQRPGVTPDGAGGPDPSLSWSAPMTPGGALGATRPVVTFARPERYRETSRTLGRRGRAAAAAVCVVLGMGLIGGAVTGSWLAGDSADAAERSTYATAGGLWHNVPVDQLFPPTVDGQGAGPGGADRTWTRIAVAPDGGCADAFDPLLRRALAPVGCRRLLRATYTDATQSYVTTVGLLFTTADAAAMRALDTRFAKEGLAARADLVPKPYAAKGTVAAAFGDKQRAAWTVSVLTDAPVVVYSVSGWADGRAVDTPQPAPAATATGATTAPAQAGLGNEAQGLADRIERGLRKTAVTPSEQPS
ncbi:hypothetical protein ACIBAH_12370 [Streptomyces sp. NPDC051445]|uniref:hypothetical protein n=1 Tax=Streptomyces sp. NPDC051445 TaxID=3365653 RepID=UPI0037AD1DAF